MWPRSVSPISCCAQQMSSALDSLSLPSLSLILEKSWGRALLIAILTGHCGICGRGKRTRRRDLEIYQTRTRAWRRRSRSLCSSCGPRLALAATHDGVLNAPNGGLIVAASSQAAGHPSHAADREGDRDVMRPPNPVVVAVWVLSILVIIGFSVLATYASPLFFLGVMIPFLPL